MGADSDPGTRPGGSGGGAGRGVGGRAPEPTRPARADLPPTDGEVAARRLIVGHLDTSGLDPVTAKAVEVLAAADMVAAEHFTPKPPRLWREPLWWICIFVLTCLVIVSVAVLLLVHRVNEGVEQRDRLTKISEQNSDLLAQVKSCVDPAGECAQRGQQTTSEAVAALSRATAIIVECADAYDGTDVIDACIARRLGQRK